MSALPNAVVAPRPTTAPTPRPDRDDRAPRLHVVRAPAHQRTRVPFVVLCMALLAAAMLGTLLLNTSMAKGEYERIALQTALARSAQDQQELLEDLERTSSAPQLARAARELGMVPAAGAGHVRLADGAVLGDPEPAAEPGEADG